MLINYAQPVVGKRELMCRTDEARISRIHAPSSPYDGMVERLQTVNKYQHSRSQEFNIHHDGYTGYVFDASELHYHL